MYLFYWKSLWVKADDDINFRPWFNRFVHEHFFFKLNYFYIAIGIQVLNYLLHGFGALFLIHATNPNWDGFIYFFLLISAMTALHYSGWTSIDKIIAFRMFNELWSPRSFFDSFRWIFKFTGRCFNKNRLRLGYLIINILNVNLWVWGLFNHQLLILNFLVII